MTWRTAVTLTKQHINLITQTSNLKMDQPKWKKVPVNKIQAASQILTHLCVTHYWTKHTSSYYFLITGLITDEWDFSRSNDFFYVVLQGFLLLFQYQLRLNLVASDPIFFIIGLNADATNCDFTKWFVSSRCSYLKAVNLPVSTRVTSFFQQTFNISIYKIEKLPVICCVWAVTATSPWLELQSSAIYNKHRWQMASAA